MYCILLYKWIIRLLSLYALARLVAFVIILIDRSSNYYMCRSLCTELIDRSSDGGHSAVVNNNSSIGEFTPKSLLLLDTLS